jgi:hypothetical protein
MEVQTRIKLPLVRTYEDALSTMQLAANMFQPSAAVQLNPWRAFEHLILSAHIIKCT